MLLLSTILDVFLYLLRRFYCNLILLCSSTLTCTIILCGHVLNSQDKVLKDMDEAEEMKPFSSSSEEKSDETDENVENEWRLQRALLEKDKV